MKDVFNEGEEFYFNSDGFIVLTEEYHLKRGYCCGNGCIHCPFEYKSVPEPKRSTLLAKRKPPPDQHG
jgi:hypothetical protein